MSIALFSALRTRAGRVLRSTFPRKSVGRSKFRMKGYLRHGPPWIKVHYTLVCAYNDYMTEQIDIRDKVFGSLTALSPVSTTHRGYTVWKCRCACGNETKVVGSLLRLGRRKTCGMCQQSVGEITALATSHPLAYRSWRKMLHRTTQPSSEKFEDNQRRGIGVCDRWRNSFPAFVADMGERPSVKHSLGRRDNDLGYSPGNCRWETAVEQNNNRRNTVFVEQGGRRWPLGEFCVRYGYPYALIAGRLKLGWSIDRAVDEPTRPKRIKQSAMVSKHTS